MTTPPETELKYCTTCVQMTNHGVGTNGGCLKCRVNTPERGIEEVEDIVREKFYGVFHRSDRGWHLITPEMLGKQPTLDDFMCEARKILFDTLLAQKQSHHQELQKAVQEEKLKHCCCLIEDSKVVESCKLHGDELQKARASERERIKTFHEQECKKGDCTANSEGQWCCVEKYIKHSELDQAPEKLPKAPESELDQPTV